MIHRVIAGGLLLLSLAAIIAGYLLSDPRVTGWCIGDAGGCISQSTIVGIGNPLYLGIRWLPVVFLALLFVPDKVFKTWWHIVLPLSILGFIVIAMTPPLGESLGPDRTTVTEYVAEFITVVSALVIAWKYWQISRTK